MPFRGSTTGILTIDQVRADQRQRVLDSYYYISSIPTYFIPTLYSVYHPYNITTTHPLPVILHPLDIASPLCRLLQPDCQLSAVRCPAYPLGQKWPSKPLIRIPETICRRVIASDGELVLSSWMPCSPFSGISGSLLTAYFITAPPPDSLESVWIPGGRRIIGESPRYDLYGVHQGQPGFSDWSRQSSGCLIHTSIICPFHKKGNKHSHREYELKVGVSVRRSLPPVGPISLLSHSWVLSE